jgi:hypothetical protein
MKKTIQWESEISAALAQAKTENKHVLLDFFNQTELAVSRWVRFRIQTPA